MIPKFDEIMLPLLQYLNDGKEHSLKECSEAMCDFFNLTKEEREEMLPSGSMTVIRNRTGWAKMYLHRSGLVINDKRNSYSISKQGIELLSQNPQKIGRDTLMHYSSFVDFMNNPRNRAGENESDIVEEDTEPTMSREELYEAFQKEFPLESLKDMPLEKYTNLNRDDSFCYWVENKTKSLGSVKGGSSFKFGIYRYENKPNPKNIRLITDDKYAWYGQYNRHTAESAYMVVRDAIIDIASNARKGNYQGVENNHVFGDAFKWKIAFLYSNLSIIPIYRRDWLNIVATKMGMENAQGSTIADIQAFLMETKGANTLFDYYDKLLVMCKNNEKQYWWLIANPNIWSLSSLKVGEIVSYTLYNKKGNKRRVFKHFLEAKAGDAVIGYESMPTKNVLCLMEIAKENDGKELYFRKTIDLQSPISRDVLEQIPELSQMEYFVNSNGSFFKLTKDEYDIIIDIINENNPDVEQVSLPSIPNSIPSSNIRPYLREDFLNDVFISEDEYDKLRYLLISKKNLILQGAPGVGKTFAAKRLAYSIMGEKDESRIEMIQFHQNYTYEDFIMGYKPTENGGFAIRTGVFYQFCKKVAEDKDHLYFFIIDEINRGNLSKIFGELLMLIESDYRDTCIKLAYRDEKFCVPSNLLIIGMMNTADRSLAMIDYALRRRFSFFEMHPSFNSNGFKAYMEGLNDDRINKIVDAVIQLNEIIAKDDSLGSGFCIGHSYFCNQKGCNDMWLSNVIEFDIIPMLREYWFDNDKKFKEESEKLMNLLR